MTTTELYTYKENCCGCELCAQACPRKVIAMTEDAEGFLYPDVKFPEACVNCGLCLRVCPMKSPGRTPLHVLESYGGHLPDEEQIRRSSSGGFATAIGREFVKRGGIVYGVKYSEDSLTVEYSRAERIEDLEQFRTSKYVQAKKGHIYEDVKKDLKDDQMVLFVGLPCEVSALYHYVGKLSAKLYTMSLICHGPTSPKVHRDYCVGLISRYKSNITSFSVRHKKEGWKPYYLKADFASGDSFLRKFKNCEYEIAFQYMKRPSCSVCHYKYGNTNFGLVSDVTLGDFHAVSKTMEHYNPWGVSQACVQSEKGQWLLDLISPTCKVAPIPKEKIEHGNIAFLQPMPMKSCRADFVSKYLSSGLTAASNLPVVKRAVIAKRIKRKVHNALSILSRLIRHK